MPAAVSVPIHLGQTARGLLRRLTPGAAAMGKRRDARRAAAHCLIQPGAAQAEAADSVPDGMPPDEASAQLAFISPASMWGAEAPQTVSPTVSVSQGGERLGDCVAPRNRAAGDAPSSEVRPQRFTPELDPGPVAARRMQSPLMRRARRRVSGAGVGLSASGSLQTATIVAWHKHTGDASDDRKAMVAIIIRLDDSRRTFQLQDAKAGAPKDEHVLDFLLSDGTSVIGVSVWGEQAEAVLNAYVALEEKTSAEELTVADIERFTVRGDDRVHLVPCRRLVPSRNTRIDIRRATSQEEETFARAALDRTLLVTDFSLLRRPAPYCCNIIGIIRNVGEPYESSKGVPMQEFEVIGRGALFVKCMAFGEYGGSDALVERAEVALFFLQSAPGLKGGSGRLWLYGNAFLVELRRNAPLLFGSREEEVVLS